VEHLKEKISLVTYDPKTDDLEEWAKKLVIDLENSYSEVAKRVNWLLERIKADGNWRIKVVGTNLEFQKKISGTWTKKGAITSSS